MSNKVGTGGDRSKLSTPKRTKELEKTAQEISKEFTPDLSSALLARFAAMNKITLRDLNSTSSSQTFYKYTKDQIATYLKDPQKNEKQIRDAVIYMYGASAHFWRIIQYFASLSDLALYLAPFKVDVNKENPDKLYKNYVKATNFIANMDIKTQCRPMITVSMREDVGYYTTWITSDNITFQQLPSDYCQISSIENNVPNVSFDFSYFSGQRESQLEFYPAEFSTKFRLYQNNRNIKWQDLDSPTSFAIKCNNDILNYALPPLAGILLNLYDLADYQSLKLTKAELENYALLVMKLGIDDKGNWQMDFDKAKEFWQNLDGVLPDEVGSVLSPMDIGKIDFDKSGGTNEVDNVAQSEQGIYSAAGVSSLLFNNEKASGNALMQSIKSDQSITYRVVKSIEAALNRLLQSQSFGKYFKLTFLDCSPYNRKELSDGYLKAATYGLPVSLYAAAVGLEPTDLETLTFLEVDTLGIKQKLVPLQSSNTMSSSSAGSSSTGAVSAGNAVTEGEVSVDGNPIGRPTAESLGEAAEGNYEPDA